MNCLCLRRLCCSGAVLLLAALFGTTGCGVSGGDFPVAETRGTIETVDGKPIANGRISLSPIPKESTAKAGKPARGEIKDGQFVLTTYGNGDGAVIGKHKVRLFEPFEPEGDDAGVGQVVKHHCEIASESGTVEIVAGENVLSLKAVPKKKRR